MAKQEVHSSFITTNVLEQLPRSHHKGASGRVRTGDQLYPVLCHCQLGQDTGIPGKSPPGPGRLAGFQGDGRILRLGGRAGWCPRPSLPKGRAAAALFRAFKLSWGARTFVTVGYCDAGKSEYFKRTATVLISNLNGITQHKKHFLIAVVKLPTSRT